MSALVFPSLPGMTVLSRERVDNVSIFETASGKEQRLGRWAAPRYRYKLGFGGGFLRSAAAYAELQALENFAGRHRGRLDSFLWSDPEDSSVIDHGFGVGDGATAIFQLQRTMGGAVYDAYGGPWASSSKPRTNLCLYSSALSNAAWSKSAVTVTPNASLAPDGTGSADAFLDTAANAQHYASQGLTSLSVGASYTVSRFLKAGAARYAYLQLGASSALFDLVAGVVIGTTTATATITPSVYGWYRCAMTKTALAGSETLILGVEVSNGVFSYAGSGQGVYAWGSQVEIGAMTQYIPTTSAAVKVTPAYWAATGDGFEPVTEPYGPVVPYVDGVTAAGWSVGASGAITITPTPGAGAVLSWTGQYFKRVRFDSDSMGVERILSQLWKGGVDLVSVL